MGKRIGRVVEMGMWGGRVMRGKGGWRKAGGGKRKVFTGTKDGLVAALELIKEKKKSRSF